MASESVTFDFIGRGADNLARDFSKIGDNAAAAAKGADTLKGKLAGLDKAQVPDFLDTTVPPGKLAQQASLIRRLLEQNKVTDFLGTSMPTGKIQQQMTLLRRLLNQNKVSDFLDVSVDTGKATAAIGSLQTGLAALPDTTTAAVSVTTDTTALADLKARLAEVKAGLTSITVGVDDTPALAKLTALQARANGLGRTVERLRVDADTTPALARLLALKAAADKLTATTTAAVSVTTDTTALADLKARLATLKTGLTSVTVGADDTPALAKLTALKVRADALGRTVEKLKVDADTTPALAKLLALKVEADKLTASTGSVKAGGGLGGLGGLIGEVTGFGAAAAAASSGGSKFQLALAGLNLASGVLEPVMAGVVVAVGGLAAGVAAAGAGLGAFGLVAKSVLTQASTAATATATAQGANAAAVAKVTAQYQVAMSTAKTQAQRNAAYAAEQKGFQQAALTQQLAVNAATAGLAPPVKTLAVELGNVKTQWKAFTDAAAPGVVGVLSQGIGILTDHMGILGKFLPPVEAALSGLLAKLNTGLSSSGFKSFIDALAANTGPAITKIGIAIGNVVVGIGGILKAFLPVSQSMLSGIDKITAKFREWGTALSGNTGFSSLMATFRTETPQAIAILKNLGGVLLNVGKAMFGLSTFSNSRLLLQALLPLSGILDTLSKNTALVRIGLYLYAAATAASKLRAVLAEGGMVESIGKITKAMLGLDAAASANVIGLIVIAVAALGTAFYIAWQKSATFRDVIKDIGVVLLAAGIVILKANKLIVDSFLSVIGTILHGLADAFGWIPGGVGNAVKAASRSFDSFKSGVDGVFNAMIGKAQDWQNSLNQSKATVATATASIVSNFRGQGAAALVGRDDVAQYTSAVQNNGSRSDQARSARARLIADLRASGLNAQQAERLVNNLQGAINNMHGKIVGVGVKASGSGGITITGTGTASGSGGIRLNSMAQGGRVPFSAGVPGQDSVLVMTKPGEIFIPPEKGPMLAPALKAAGIPGFAAGGFAGMGNTVGQLAGFTSGQEDSDTAESLRTLVGRAIAAGKAKAAAAAAAAQKAAAGIGYGNWGAATGDAASAQRYAASRLSAYGWAANQILPLMALWNQESGWNRFAYNASSGATGIPQSLPYSKMPRAAWLPSQGGQANAGAQIDWGLGYIRSVYGSPAGAWSHEVSHNWYDNGGMLKPGLTLAYNGTGRPEQVIPAGHGGGAPPVIFEISGGGSGTFDAFLLKWIQEHVRVRGGGSAQKAFGHPGVK